MKAENYKIVYNIETVDIGRVSVACGNGSGDPSPQSGRDLTQQPGV